MSRTVITGGRLVDADTTADTASEADVAVDAESGLIVEIGPSGTLTDGASEVLDAGGCVVAPGLVDLNTHLRQPGSEGAETIESGALAAALGGYTAIVAMPDTDPCTDSAAVVAEVAALAKGAACEVVPAAALTAGRDGLALAPLGELLDAGVRFFTDAGRAIQDPEVLRRAMEYLGGVAEAAGVSAVVANLPDLAALGPGGVMNEGDWSARLGLPGRPAVAEELQLARDLALARLTGANLHVQQVSTAGSVALLREAKRTGDHVTAEVSPHHLVFDESDCQGYDPNLRLTPPLRTTNDVAELRAAVLDGTIDAIATAHSPWVVDHKEQPFADAPPGVIGLETTLAALLTEWGVAVEVLLPALSWRPAAIAGLDDHGGPIEVGRPANLCVIDPETGWTVDARHLASRSTNTPFDGRTLTGQVRHTVRNGHPTVVDARPGDDPRTGPREGNNHG